jgi:membrane-associated protease RseP (regulator of RpoE activity)
MAERVRKLFEQLQKGGAGLLPDGLLARPRLEAEGLVLEQIGAGQVQLKVKRDAETGAATVEDLYVGRSLTEILEANPELAKLPGMEDLKRQDAKRSWPGMEDFFKRGMSGGRVSPFPGGSGFTFSSSSGVSYSQDANGVTVKITEPDKEGKPVTKEYKGASIEEIKKAHPEIADKLNGMNVTMRVMPPNFFWPNRPRSSPFIGPTTPSARPRSVPRHGLFGISLEKPDDALASHLKLRPGSAAIVRSVTPGSPAHKLGLQVNDIIVEINGSPVSLDSAIATLRGIGAGAGALELEIIRAGEPRTLSR